MNFRNCTSQTHFTVCPIILLLGAANNHSISHGLYPCFNKAVSALLTSHLFWANTLLHFLPCSSFSLCLIIFSSLSSLSWSDPNYVPCSLSLNKRFSNGVTVCPFLLPTPFLVFLSILLGFVIVTPMIMELVIARPTQASFLRKR